MMPRCGAPAEMVATRDEPEPGGATIYDTAFVRRCATDETYNGELLSARDFDSWLARVKAEALAGSVPLCKARRGGNMCTRAEGHDGRHSWTAL